MTARIDTFGMAPEGPVERVWLAGGGLTANVLSWGASVQDLRLEGVEYPLVLGADRFEPYLGPMDGFGAIVGRFANRIGEARVQIDGTPFDLDRNWLGRHTLHGGDRGAGRRNWSISEATTDRAVLSLDLPDGNMGFPGNLQVTATYWLQDQALCVEVEATTDAATPCSFAHHGYFNLDSSDRIDGHRLRVLAPAYLPVDGDQIPTGEIALLEGSPFDFRTARPIDREAIDHNFCLGRKPGMRVAAELHAPAPGLTMTVETDAPGLQVYTAEHVDIPAPGGLSGRRYGSRAGIALETQAWPDAPNKPTFPDAILRPGEIYLHRVRYRFGHLP